MNSSSKIKKITPQKLYQRSQSFIAEMKVIWGLRLVNRRRMEQSIRQAYANAEQESQRIRLQRLSEPQQAVQFGPIGKAQFPIHDPPLFFPPSALAHRVLDGLAGLEIGAAAHNAFGLNAKNVGLSPELDPDDFDFFKEAQISMCGKWAPIDIPGFADAIPVPDSSQDFVLHSHVWEHLPNPLGALDEWVRVVRSGGYIYAIVPKRTAEPSDVGRPVTPTEQHIVHHLLKSKHEERRIMDGLQMRGHYSVFDPKSLLEIETWFNLYHPGARLKRIAFQGSDDKVGNGHAVVWRVTKNASRTLPLATPETSNAIPS